MNAIDNHTGEDRCGGCKLSGFCGTTGSCATDEDVRSREITAIWLCLAVPCALFLVAVIAVSAVVSAFGGCVAGGLSLVAYFGAFRLLHLEKRLFKDKKR